MKTLRHLLPLVAFVLAALVGLTYWKTGKVGLWPGTPGTQYDAPLEKLRDERQPLVKQLGEEKNTLMARMGGYDQAAANERIAELERRIQDLDAKIATLERYRRAELEKLQPKR